MGYTGGETPDPVEAELSQTAQHKLQMAQEATHALAALLTGLGRHDELQSQHLAAQVNN